MPNPLAAGRIGWRQPAGLEVVHKHVTNVCAFPPFPFPRISMLATQGTTSRKNILRNWGFCFGINIEIRGRGGEVVDVGIVTGSGVSRVLQN